MLRCFFTQKVKPLNYILPELVRALYLHAVNCHAWVRPVYCNDAKNYDCNYNNEYG